MKIVTVHGTFAQKDESSGDEWWQKNSQFNTSLAEALSPDYEIVSFVPFHWDGANSERSRINAGKELSQLLLQMEECGDPYCVLAHSHGGNVVVEAENYLQSNNKQLEKAMGVFSFGTPFLRKEAPFYYRVIRSLRRISTMMIGVIGFLIALSLALIGISYEALSPQNFGLALILVVCFVGIFGGLFYLVGTTIFGFNLDFGRLTPSLSQKKGSPGFFGMRIDSSKYKWFSFCEGRDEAMFFLRKLPKIRLSWINPGILVSVAQRMLGTLGVVLSLPVGFAIGYFYFIIIGIEGTIIWHFVRNA